MTTAEYLENIGQRYALGNSTEHSFRADLQNLLETLLPDIQATNEPKRIECGAPDFILTKNEIPVGFIEAKNIGDKDLEGAKKNGNKAQFDRYKAALGNLIFTDYLEFHFYQNGIFVTKIRIGEVKENQILPLFSNFTTFENLLKGFCLHLGQSIENPNQLAQMLAGKAKLLAEVIEKALQSDEKTEENSTLKEQLDAFKQILIHDISPRSFADVYAQTIAYGMFAARLHDTDLQAFSRQKAAELIPKSNPFLRKLFSYIAGVDLDDRIRWIVESLVEIFLYCDIEKILQNYGKSTHTEDPIIHFYETFLAEYDPETRKNRGVWYTPAPVVNFIVRAVDDILRTDFDLEKGLAEKVQILDPATGTGTFLAEIVKQIRKKFVGQEGVWQTYVENDLLPRLNGFELLMASYAMAHLQLDLLLKKTGYKSLKNQRLRIFLTNSLQESHAELERGFANWLSAEANEANAIKRTTPVMCVIGNPPYAVSSLNRGTWIQNLIADYKKGLKEKSYNSLSDDYVKFIRFGQYFIDKNGSGLVAYISNNSFLDGITHRQMRKSLLESFDQIYILDLHGNARKKETTTEGLADQNVFDIMQGVSINIFVKTGKKAKGELGKVSHYDLQGKRKEKFDFLNKNSLKSVKWQVLNFEEPYYFFVPKNFDLQAEYEHFFGINELFEIFTSGIKTHQDELLIAFNEKELAKKLNKYWEKNREKAVFDAQKCKKIHYRPFDDRVLYYDLRMVLRNRYEQMQHNFHENYALLSGRQTKSIHINHFFIGKFVSEMKTAEYTSGSYHFPLYLYSEKPKTKELSAEKKADLELKLEENRMLLQQVEKSFANVQKLFEKLPNPDKNAKKWYENEAKSYQKIRAEVEKLMGLLEPPTNGTFFEEQPRKPNFNKEIVQKIAEKIGLEFVNETPPPAPSPKGGEYFSPLDLLDYIYAVLHSPNYREKYQSFLKIDFPRVPYPENSEEFRTLTNFGSELRKLHLLESPLLDELGTSYPVSGENLVENIKFAKPDRIYINENQYFDNISETVWNFYVGGYQPAQKWLKDRKDRNLSTEEILHYQKLIGALAETERIMGEIDMETLK